MLDVVAPVLHSRDPAEVVDRVDDSQLLSTVTTGAAGIGIGVALPLPGGLGHPSTVCVTV